MSRKREAVWQFACPECGFGNVEIGGLAADDEIHCLVCLEEADRHIRLHRWLAVREAPGRTVSQTGSLAA